MKNERIRSCPFCGSNRVDMMKTGGGDYWVKCANEDCLCETNTSMTRAKAVASWNHRDPNNRTAQVVYDMDLPEKERVERYQRMTGDAPAT